jgi:fatty-acyl-CoA synthase
MWLHAEISTLADIPRHWAAATPGNLAVRDADRVLTYASLNERSDRVAAAIAGYKVPKQIYFTDSLPMTSSGKIRKAMLRQQHRTQSAASLA